MRSGLLVPSRLATSTELSPRRLEDAAIAAIYSTLAVPDEMVAWEE